MSSRRPQTEYLVRRTGLTGAIGATLMAVTAAYYWSVIRPLHADAQRLAEEVANASEYRRGEDVQGSRQLASEDRVRAFYDFFPPSKEGPSWIAKIYAAADAENLVLSRGEYRRVAVKEEEPAQLQISLPIKGSYTQVRRFLTRALANIPVLALDEINFQRQAAGGTQLEAEIRFTLFLRNQ